MLDQSMTQVKSESSPSPFPPLPRPDMLAALVVKVRVLNGEFFAELREV